MNYKFVLRILRWIMVYTRLIFRTITFLYFRTKKKRGFRHQFRDQYHKYWFLKTKSEWICKSRFVNCKKDFVWKAFISVYCNKIQYVFQLFLKQTVFKTKNYIMILAFFPLLNRVLRSCHVQYGFSIFKTSSDGLN